MPFLAAGFAAVAPIPPDELLPYPPMQWHSWGLFTHAGDDINEANMNEMADALISSGMAAAGYDTVNVVCNGWIGRDPVTHQMLENRTLWPSGIKGFAARLHSLDPPLKVGCYTAPSVQNCQCGKLPDGTCEDGCLGHEVVDMHFFADAGCDHVMVDNVGDQSASFTKRTYAVIGDAIANSSNPNMVYGIWSGGFGKSWRWAGDVGGHYWRMGTDSYDSWDSLMRQWDTTYSIPDIHRFTKPGRFSFLDQMIIGDVPHRKGSAYGPGLNHDEAVAHMSMWVMAASPLLTCTDVRNMSTEIKAILTNTEVLAVHKDPLARMAMRVDVGGGKHELHSANLCANGFPQCQQGPGDPGYLGRTCQECRSNWSVWEKPLHDHSSAVMVFNRDNVPQTVTVNLEDIGDALTESWSGRDLWAHKDLGVVTTSFQTIVPAHGVKLYRMKPHTPTPPSPAAPTPAPICPTGFTTHVRGLWSNPKPCGYYPTPPNCTTVDKANNTAPLCAQKCKATTGCLAFELFASEACYIFLNKLGEPFVPNDQCLTCVLNRPTERQKATDLHEASDSSSSPNTAAGFEIRNGTFLLNSKPIRLFAGALQHFRIHPQHWEHRLALAKAMGLNAVQTLIPWMMMVI